MPKWLWAYVSLVLIAVAITCAQNIWDLGKADWAAWFQAIGSLVAIVIAIYVPYAQRKNAEQETRFDRARRLRVATQVIKLCIDCAAAWIEEIERSAESTEITVPVFDLAVFARLVQALDSFEIQNLPTPDALTMVLSAAHCARKLSAAQQTAKDEVDKTWAVSDKSEAEIRIGHTVLIEIYNSLLNECVVVETGPRGWSGFATK
jgi:hypothetical protein